MDFYLAVILFAVTMTITPGPNNVMIMTSGVNWGLKKSLPHFLGICVGFPIMIVLEGMSFSALFELYPVLHDIIQILGVLYLLYLTWLIATAASVNLESKDSKPFSFIQAALFQWVNPKAWVIATSAISAYTSAGADMLIQVLSISLIFLCVGIPCVGSWLLFGAKLKTILKSHQSQKVFNIAMACLLVISVMPAIYDLLHKYHDIV